LTRELGGALADLAETRGLLAAARVALDETRSALTERLGDLATLRRQILRERDESAERIVGLIEDARVWRLVPRKLRGWEREFLEGPGAGFVRKKLR
jgi:hypothetical protein